MMAQLSDRVSRHSASLKCDACGARFGPGARICRSCGVVAAGSAVPDRRYLVLLCHPVGDQPLAFSLGRALAADGHRIAFHETSDSSSNSPHPAVLYDPSLSCLIAVVWTRRAVASNRLIAVAEAARRAGRLLLLRDDTLPFAKIPRAFQQLYIIPSGDTAAIARQVDHLSERLRSGLAPAISRARPTLPSWLRPPPEPTHVQTVCGPAWAPRNKQEVAEQAAFRGRELERYRRAHRAWRRTFKLWLHQEDRWERDARRVPYTGVTALAKLFPLVCRIPAQMWLHCEEAVEIRITPEVSTPSTDRSPSSDPSNESALPIVESMSMRLISEDAAIDIQMQSQAMQLAVGPAVGLDAPPTADFGRWMWLVTPCRPGRHSLLLRANATLRDRRGVLSDAPLPDQQLEISVRKNGRRPILQRIAQLSRTLAELRSGRSV